MNPFVISMPVDFMDDLLFREKTVMELDRRIVNRQHTVVMGVEGAGKSSLLRSFFNNEYKKKKALEGVLISPVKEFPEDHDAEKCFKHFSRIANNAVGILGDCGKENMMNKIRSDYERCIDENTSAAECFEYIMESIRENGYRIVMVIDNFERFTMSPNITKDHYGVLLKTMEKLLDNAQYIISTNYDLSKNSLPSDLSDSFFITRFAGNRVEVKGWNKSECEKFIKLKLEGDEIQFSPELIRLICDVSGGVPYLMNLTAQFAYDYIERHGSEEGVDFEKDFYRNNKSVKKILEHWCMMLTHNQKQFLREIPKGNGGTEGALYARGITKAKITYDARFNREIPNDQIHDFCCCLLEYFCRDGDRLEMAMEKNPLRELGDPIVSLQRKITKTPFKDNEPYIFISYAHKDAFDVYNDVAELKKRFNCWVDFENLDGGRTRDEDDWTEKVKPVLESDLCKGVIMYLSPEAIKESVGFLQEALWIEAKKHQFYTFFMGFEENITPKKMSDFLFENLLEKDRIAKRNMGQDQQKAFGYICQTRKPVEKVTYHLVHKSRSHLNESDFVNWIKCVMP